jgi:hypothetical protein
LDLSSDNLLAAIEAQLQLLSALPLAELLQRYGLLAPLIRRTVEDAIAEQVEAAVGEEFYHVIVQAILHAADLCNHTLDFRTSAAWSLRLSAEFAGAAARQDAWVSASDPERGMATPGGDGVEELLGRRERGVNENTDVDESVAHIAKGEMGFAATFVLPYFKALAMIYPVLQRHAERAKETMERYEGIVQNLNEEEA